MDDLFLCSMVTNVEKVISRVAKCRVKGLPMGEKALMGFNQSKMTTLADADADAGADANASACKR